MKLETKYVGEVEVNDSMVIEFDNGIFAFEEYKKFALVPFGEDTPFFSLQSLEDADLAFIVANPFHFFSDYKVKLPDVTIEVLGLEKEEDVAIFVILTVQDPFSKTTANLQAPIVIHAKTQQGKQIILSDSHFQTKHYLLPQEATPAGEGK